MDAAKTLFQPVWVPWQVVVHHEMGALEVDTFTGRVGRQQNLYFRIMAEGFLCLHPILAAHATMDHDNGLSATEEGRDLAMQVVERVAMLGEQNQLLGGRWRRLGN